jgi:hypothetical protein
VLSLLNGPGVASILASRLVAISSCSLMFENAHEGSQVFRARIDDLGGEIGVFLNEFTRSRRDRLDLGSGTSLRRVFNSSRGESIVRLLRKDL